MFKFISTLLFLNVVILSNAQNEILSDTRVDESTYQKLINEARKNNIKNEHFTIETDKFGRILNIKCLDSLNKKIFKDITLIATKKNSKDLTPTISILLIRENQLRNVEIVNIKNEAPLGKLLTIIKLQSLIKDHKFEMATLLFSNKIKPDITKYKKEGDFNKWIAAWTLNSTDLNQFTNQILNGKGNFIFEENEWKINEH